MSHDHQRGRDFIEREGRVLERRLAAALFEGTPAEGVVDALRGFQNPDGGFGYGLEPDTRCPDSLPICTEVALSVLDAAGTVDVRMVERAGDFLASVADEQGAVPLALPAIEAYPRASHMTDWTYRPGLNPTAGLAGLLYALEVDHPWLETATAACWSTLDGDGVPREAHALHETLVFLEHQPDDERTASFDQAIRDALPDTEWLLLDPGADGYGVTPLHLAPTPESRWLDLFSTEVIEGHLERLAGLQQDDGGWPITWEPPGTAATQEWRAIETLRALRALDAWSRA